MLRYSEKIDKITVREALELSLTYSDNMLNRVCGYDINSYISCLTGEDMTVGNLTTVKELIAKISKVINTYNIIKAKNMVK